MGRIIKLDEHLSNMIAAGEVVERPMGVIKELVENAIDAGATRIQVKIIDGGIQSIQVIDNGCGMDQEDAVNAFQRHATSKIRTINDLWSIHTLGFRGEALPSIASVSKVNLLTCDGKDSTRIDMEYGKMVSAGPYAVPKGTDITVSGLFHKTPARLKHMKSVNTETNAIIDVMEKFAFSHPEISFSLVCNDVTKLETPGNGSLAEVAYRVYGKEIAKNCVDVSFEDYDFKVEGVIVLPHVTRATKQYMTIFINGRMVHHYLIQKAILEAYRKYISPDRYPICILNVKMDYQLVDVNVHPSKWEIRLSKEKQLHDLISKEIHHQINGHMNVLEVESHKTLTTPKPKVELQNLFEDVYISSEPVEKQETVKVKEEPVVYTTLVEEVVSAEKVVETAAKVVEVKEEIVAKKNNLPELKVIGQLHGKYILAQGEQGLYIIDQHAAQEKYNYEVFKKAISKQNFTLQPLLMPIVLELPSSQMVRMEEMNEQLLQIGIHFEPFGSNTILCREIPNWIQKVEVKEFLQDMIDLYSQNKTYTIDEIRKEAIASLACHYSIKFNRHLSNVEMQQVINDLGECDEPYHCPHGRPTLISISEKQLIKEFKRG